MNPADIVPPRLDAAQAAALAARVLAAVGGVVIGKDLQIRLGLACLLADGHLLIEDVPGVGKTTLAHAYARALGLAFQRVQFTSDLLPSDVIGGAIFDREQQRFVFHPGPVFTQVLLADEINRASPKTQSALLEAMEERQVSAEGETRRLPDPFFVIATQNPTRQLGTFPLPESQLDRFLMRLSLGYPSREAERALLMGEDRRGMLRRLDPVLTPAELRALHTTRAAQTVTPMLVDYVQRLIEASRDPRRFVEGLSPRAGLALLQAARAWALIDGRDFVLPDDIQAVLPSVAGHRLVPAMAGNARALQIAEAIAGWMRAVPVEA
ncbi:AAA family ATPase [Derxia gummosa]|uniref:AAA family ATPase n=1 Tax=Derxia gummosa DSM 723 TaxID=1121388 RepID=A0A8B6XAL9_9BURK|nr:MoxR family ATPase [Derxia gummosa]